jgi:hypothetical protein
MCVYKKTSHIKKQGVLQLLLIPMQRWRDILINFIVDLPSSNRFTNIIVVVNRLMKMRHMVPIDSINAVLVAKCFIRYIFKLHRLPNSIISNRGSQFISDFWQALYK